MSALSSGATSGAASVGGPSTLRPSLEFVTTVTVECEPELVVGNTPAGARRVVPILGGTVNGPLLQGTVLGKGSDWNVVRSDGLCVVSAHYLLRTHDGVVVDVLNEGILDGRTQPLIGTTTPRFEAPDGPYAWLNEATFVGTLHPMGGSSVRLDFFRVCPPSSDTGPTTSAPSR